MTGSSDAAGWPGLSSRILNLFHDVSPSPGFLYGDVVRVKMADGVFHTGIIFDFRDNFVIFSYDVTGTIEDFLAHVAEEGLAYHRVITIDPRYIIEVQTLARDARLFELIFIIIMDTGHAYRSMEKAMESAAEFGEPMEPAGYA